MSTDTSLSASPGRSVEIGSFDSVLPPSSEHLTIVFSPATASLTERWKNKNLSADFLADYFSNFFPGQTDAPARTSAQAEVRSAISYIANELLENALKFNHDPAHDVSIHLRLYPDRLVMQSTNSADPAGVSAWQERIHEMLSGDPSELYIQQLERNALEDGDESGIGLLSMLQDYNALLGWRFEWQEQATPPAVQVTTMVTLTL